MPDPSFFRAALVVPWDACDRAIPRSDHSPPHQLARQSFNRFPEAPVTRHVEQLVDDLLQRRRINVTPEGLRNFPDRVVGGWHAGDNSAVWQRE
jgi:hypothetical protein